VKKKAYFYHCSFCRFDVCPHCSNNWTAELTAGRKPKHTKEQADKEEANPHKRKKDWSWAQESAPGVPGARERRDIWIPTEEESVSRAPSAVNVVSEWVEGLPV
ncbi:unnamed protein product, partial [Polarella glacialis]